MVVSRDLFSYDYNSTRLTDSRIIDNKKASLGRVLFYDKGVSVNNAKACASCHVQAFAFSDGNQVSMGFMQTPGTRNAMPLFNLPEDGFYFWDMRARNLKDMILDPAVHKTEMGMGSPEEIVKKFRGIGYIQDLFNHVYELEKDQDITEDRIRECLAEFVLSIQSHRSHFDGAAQNISQLPLEVQAGRSVFITAQCNNCHGEDNFNNQAMQNSSVVFVNHPPNFRDKDPYRKTPSEEKDSSNNAASIFFGQDFANIGLDYSYSDPGMSMDLLHFLNAKNPGQGFFKIPSLRNLAYTAPYMHDGRFATLDEVLNHYNREIKDNSVLDERLRIHVFGTDPNSFDVLPQHRKLNLSEEDIKNLKSFLLYLSDEQLVRDPKWSSPFVPVP